MKRLNIFIVSDSVGETGEYVTNAVVSQFRPNLQETMIRKFPNIDTKEGIRQIVELAVKQEAMIVYTLVQKCMRDFIRDLCSQQQVQSVDLLGPIMAMIESYTAEDPLEEPGLLHQLDADYFNKIEAIEFAVKYDDGRDPRGLLLADIVLIGVSRTSKTPLSQYLAHKRYKVANVPLVPEVEPPEELYLINPKKCFGLVISPEKLNYIRKERLMTLGLNDDAVYAQRSRIEEEIAYFEKVTQKIGCQVIDVTNKAVEETANIVLESIQAEL